MNDSLAAYHFKVDSTTTNVSIYKRNDDEVFHNFKLVKTDSLKLQIKGKIDSDSLEIYFKAKNLKEIILINRGFHWINESPYNR